MNEDEKKIVIARLQSLPANIRASIGNFGAFGKHELIEHVERGDEIGSLVVQIYMNGLRSFKKEVESHAK